MDLSSKYCLMLDHGLWPSFAERLAREYGKVGYYMPLGDAFPKSAKGMIGTGLEGVDRIYDFMAEVPKADVIFFPDIYEADLQDYLRSEGYPVWGSGHTDHLELDRWGTHRLMKELGMPAPVTKRFVGVDALSVYLHEEDDLYVKTSFYRGDFETYHHTTWKVSESWVDELRHRLGPRAATIEFIVEEPVEGKEVGFDGYHVNGEFGPISTYGYEIKDAGFIGRVCPYPEVPEGLRYCLESFAPMLKGVSANLSNEVRFTSRGKPYLIDPCMRCAMPPTSALQEVFSNWGEVIHEGARGNMVALEPEAKYFAELIHKSHWADNKWLPVHYPAKLNRWVKLRNKAVIDGTNYVAPLGYEHYASVVGMGDSLEEAIAECQDHCTQVEAIESYYDEDALDRALDAIEKGEEHGINWG